VSSELEGEIKFDEKYSYNFELGLTDLDSLFIKNRSTSLDVGKNFEYIADRIQSGGRIIDERPFGKQYLSTTQVYHFHDTSRTAPLKQTARLQDNQSLRADGSNLPAFLYQLQQTDIRAFNRIEATIRTIAPFFERFDLQPNGDYIRLNWRQKGTDMYLDAADLSDGTIRFVALCTLLAQPNPPRTIIIDEPELGLHPYAISILAELVKNISDRTQVILSTQSVNLVNEFEPEDIIVVENQHNQSTFNRLEKQALSEWLDDYTIGDLWYKNVIGGNP
jgi:predicted ATPase